MRLLIHNEWFDAISSEGQYESDFETMVLNNGEFLFPEYIVVPFKARVESSNDVKIPDLALVDKQYRHWWVVEVEMAHHSLQGHVLSQVETFATGKYGPEHAEYLANHSAAIDLIRARDMIRGEQPRVLVIVNQSVPAWVDPIRRLNGMLTIVEVFRSFRNVHVLRVNGDSPTYGPPDRLSKCRLDSVIPRLLEIDSPAALEIGYAQRIKLLFKEGITEWERMAVADRVWLNPVNRNPLVSNQEYNIVRRADGVLCIEEAATSRGVI